MRNIQQITVLILIVFVSMGEFSCKSQKKIAAEQAAAEQARKIAKAKADLEELLSNQSEISLDEKERRLATIKELNIDDPEVDELIVRVEEKLGREREAMEAKEKAQRMAEERAKRLRAESKEQRGVAEYFDLIAQSNSLESSDRYIDEALQLFANDNAPVLIIISRSGNVVDYDRPTTIRKYLEYIKDQKVVRNKVENVVYNADGKITELELIKK
jgi:hypothetical protein